MLIGVPKETKVRESRVGMTPAGVRELVEHGHRVLVEHDAARGVGFDDDTYAAAGAEIATCADAVFSRAELIVKVKEPLAEERRRLSAGQTLFTYLHLAPDAAQTSDLLASGATCIAYETVTSALGGLPLLAPMSEVAGRMSVQAGAHCLEMPQRGRGILLGGVPGVEPASVVVIGGGVVGSHAVRIALGMGAKVWVLDRNTEVLRSLSRQHGNALITVFATRDAVETLVPNADLVIGGVLVPGASAPKIVSIELIRRMKPGAVIVDVAIDQGGCFETSRPTTHEKPTYEVDGIVHYCVTNMPGAVPVTSTFALTNATLPFVVAIADKGVVVALRQDPCLLSGLNIHKGRVTHPAVAASLGLEYVEPMRMLLH